VEGKRVIPVREASFLDYLSCMPLLMGLLSEVLKVFTYSECIEINRPCRCTSACWSLLSLNGGISELPKGGSSVPLEKQFKLRRI